MTTPASQSNTVDLSVEGMSCGACVRHVTQALRALPGIDEVTVDLPSGQVQVASTAGLDAAPLIAALDAAGYPARKAEPRAATSGRSDVEGSPVRRGGCCCR